MKRLLAIAIIAAFVLSSWGCSADGTKAANAYLAAKNMEKVAAETLSPENIAKMKTSAKEYANNGIETVKDTGDMFETRAKNLERFLEGETDKAKEAIKKRPTIKISTRARLLQKAKGEKSR